MKVGIITVQNGRNFGASLQAYALVKFLRNNNIDAYLIDYRTRKIEERMKSYDQIKRWNNPTNIKYNLKKYFKEIIFNSAQYDKQRKEKFENFHKQIFDMSLGSLYNCNDLARLNKTYDAFICGSDQIWNPDITDLDDAFFLAFANEGKRKIAYAPSLGMASEKVNSNLKAKLQKKLESVQYLSIREENNKKIVEELTDRKCTTTLDPVKHICANTINDKDKMVQSKYIQSEIEYCFREIENYLKMGKKVLFTGTPCQVAGLKLFLKNKNLDNLFLCDVLCGGNVSPGFFQEYVKFIEKNRKDKVSSVCFRTKKLGWKQHHIRIILQNSEYEGARKNEEPFFSLYLKKYIIRDACFKCEFASKQRVSDITMGDFWGIEKKDPKIDDDKGISIAIVNTEKGQKLIDAIKNKIYIEKRDLDIAVPKQINLQRPPLKPREREKFWNDYVKKGSEYTLKKYTTFGLKEKVIVYLKRIVRRVRVK